MYRKICERLEKEGKSITPDAIRKSVDAGNKALKSAYWTDEIATSLQYLFIKELFTTR